MVSPTGKAQLINQPRGPLRRQSDRMKGVPVGCEGYADGELLKCGQLLDLAQPAR